MSGKLLHSTVIADNIEHFLSLANKRHQIYLRRASGAAPPWSDDPIFRDNRFCNLYRELDKTTVWFRENMRDQPQFQKSPSAIVLTTVAFRWFNKIEIGKVLMDSAIGLAEGKFDVEQARARILREYPKGPFVTGAYIVKTPDGMKKLDGVLWCIDKVAQDITRLASRIYNSDSLEKSWEALREFPYLGDFMAYEVVSDLRWTPLLSGQPENNIKPATDIDSWANPGPGCARGVSRLFYGDPDALSRSSKVERAQLIVHMQELLREAHAWWGVNFALGSLWEMREVEHWLCEYDKYNRVLDGGRMKQKFDWRTRA